MIPSFDSICETPKVAARRQRCQSTCPSGTARMRIRTLTRQSALRHRPTFAPEARHEAAGAPPVGPVVFAKFLDQPLLLDVAPSGKEHEHGNAGNDDNRAGGHPRVVQELMRHSDIKLTMKVYTDPSQLPLAAALHSLPLLHLAPAETAPEMSRATG